MKKTELKQIIKETLSEDKYRIDDKDLISLHTKYEEIKKLMSRIKSEGDMFNAIFTTIKPLKRKDYVETLEDTMKDFKLMLYQLYKLNR